MKITVYGGTNNKSYSEQEIQACAILDTMVCGISDLYESFSDFIELEVKNL